MADSNSSSNSSSSSNSTSSSAADAQHYDISASLKPTLVVCLLFFVSIGLGSAVHVFETRNPELPVWRGFAAAAFIFAVWGIFIGLCVYGLKQIKTAALKLDDEGIWPAHLPRQQSLMRWQELARIKERRYLQRLELIDQFGRKRLRVEFQLQQFKALRTLLAQKLLNNKKRLTPLQLPQSFQRRRSYHIGYIVGLSLITLFALLFMLVDGWILIAMLALIGASVAHSYCKEPYRITITEQQVFIRYPLRTRMLYYAEIEKLELEDEYYEGYRTPEVWLHYCAFLQDEEHDALSEPRKNKPTYNPRTQVNWGFGPRPIKLQDLGVDANLLYITLTRAKAAADNRATEKESEEKQSA